MNHLDRMADRATVFLDDFLRPTLDFMGEKYEGKLAERQLLAIALQESGLVHRVQVRGPARGFFQFEISGCQEALRLDRENFLAGYTARTLYDVLPQEECVMVVAARLLLRRHPDPLPKLPEYGWKQYMSLWRPGKPHPDRWPACWEAATIAVER